VSGKSTTYHQAHSAEMRDADTRFDPDTGPTQKVEQYSINLLYPKGLRGLRSNAGNGHLGHSSTQRSRDTMCCGQRHGSMVSSVSHTCAASTVKDPS